MPKAAQKFTVSEAIEILKKFEGDAEVRGFQTVKVVTKPVSVTAVSGLTTKEPS